MHGRAIKVRQVFAELRRAFGIEIPAGKLLRLAAQLVDATQPRDDQAKDRITVLRPGSDQLPLDKAFADGGWRMMAREHHWTPETDWDDDPGTAIANVNYQKMRYAA
jgi:hypothetical protein